jgi:hypothetical protein
VASRCQVVKLATKQNNPAALAVAGGRVFWSVDTGSGGAIQRFDGAIQSVVANQQESITGVAADTTRMYWTEPTIVGWAYVDGTKQAAQPADSGAVALAIDDANVYWTSPTSVAWIPKGGGSLGLLATQQSSPAGITAGGGFVYWANQGMVGSIARAAAPPAPPAVETLAQDPSGPLRIAVDARYVYWTNARSQLLFHANASTTPASGTVLASGANGVAADGQNVYWTDSKDGIVWRAPAGGGQAVILAGNQDTPTQIAVDDAWVYWINRGPVDVDAGMQTFTNGEVAAVAK